MITDRIDFQYMVAQLLIIVPIVSAAFLYCIKAILDISAVRKTKAEVDIQLFKQFTELMDLANGRGKSEISNSAIEKAFDTAGVLTPIMLANGKDLHNQLYDIAVFSMPVGCAAQNAAITSVYKLGQRHSVLKQSAITGLKQLAVDLPSELASAYAEKLEK
jgi:hypothetical protein